MFAGFLVMSLVEDSHAGGGNQCFSPNCDLDKVIDRHNTNKHSGNIGKDSPLHDTTFGEALEFLKRVQDKW